MFGQSLTQKLTTKLSPQQIHLMKLLVIPTVALEQRVKEEMEINPALEEGESDLDAYGNETLSDNENFFGEDEKEDDDTESVTAEEEIPLMHDDSYNDEYDTDWTEEDPIIYDTAAHNPDEEDRTMPIAVENNLQDYLLQQLGLIEIPDERYRTIAEHIIGSIDEDGYLRRDTESICDDMLVMHNMYVPENEIADILDKIQRFDPPGVGARDLRECLLIQLRTKLTQNDLDPVVKNNIQTAYRLIDEFFDEYSKKHYTRLVRQLSVTEEMLKAADAEVRKLNPKPASGYNDSASRNVNYILPDFIITNRDGDPELTLNSRNAPDLRVSEYYQEMLTSMRNGNLDRSKREAIAFIKQKIDSAKWFIDAIRQRQQTMYKTMHAILFYQYDFFKTGDQKRIKPMILKDIADVTDLDISTISRVANSKFVQTEFGTFRLKDFFSEALINDEGDEVSTLEVKKILTEIINEESKRKPHSDEKLKSMLQKRGYNIARRTVAKYREQLNIPVARLRKEL